MVLHVHFVKVDHETLLIVGSLGVQLSSTYASGRESTTFIEMNKIKDIVINEAVYMVSAVTIGDVTIHLNHDAITLTIQTFKTRLKIKFAITNSL